MDAYSYDATEDNFIEAFVRFGCDYDGLSKTPNVGHVTINRIKEMVAEHTGIPVQEPELVWRLCAYRKETVPKGDRRLHCITCSKFIMVGGRHNHLICNECAEKIILREMEL